MMSILHGSIYQQECCQCCRMGLEARSLNLGCDIPDIGNPCDRKFTECCRGSSGNDVTDVIGIVIYNLSINGDIL